MRIALKSRVRVSVTLMSMVGMLAAVLGSLLWDVFYPREFTGASSAISAISIVLGGLFGAVVGEDPMSKFISDNSINPKILRRAAFGGGLAALIAVAFPSVLIALFFGMPFIFSGSPVQALASFLTFGFWTLGFVLSIFGLPALALGCLGGMLVQVIWSKLGIRA